MKEITKNILKALIYLLVIVLIGRTTIWTRTTHIYTNNIWSARGIFLLRQYMNFVFGIGLSYEVIAHKIKTKGIWKLAQLVSFSF